MEMASDTLLSLHIIPTEASLLDAFGVLNALPSGASMTLVAIDASGRVAGTITDGDLRRALLAGGPLTATVDSAMRRGFESVGPGDDYVERLRMLRLRGIRLIPEVDRDGRPVSLIDLGITINRLPLSAILMAGGKGERLRPLTLSTPKPLLPVGDKAIMDYNLDALARVGVTDVSVSVNYLAEQIESHLALRYPQARPVREPFAMGTLGSASLCKVEPEGSTLVMNADLLTTISFEDLFIHHRKSGAAVTIAAIPYNVSVPYAILDTEGGRVRGLKEKPSYSYYANAGIYIFENRLLGELPPRRRTDAPDFIEEAIAAGERVSYFPVSGTWIDIGSPADYAHACELMKHIGPRER